MLVCQAMNSEASICVSGMLHEVAFVWSCPGIKSECYTPSENAIA